MERVETALRLALAYFDAFNRRDADAILSLLSDDCVFEESGPAPDGSAVSGREAVAENLRIAFERAPDSRLEIEEIFGAGFRCAARWKRVWTGADGRPAHERGIDVFHIKGDLIVKKCGYAKT